MHMLSCVLRAFGPIGCRCATIGVNDCQSFLPVGYAYGCCAISPVTLWSSHQTGIDVY
jgi:hypothetical protein